MRRTKQRAKEMNFMNDRPRPSHFQPLSGSGLGGGGEESLAHRGHEVVVGDVKATVKTRSIRTKHK
jgi:hypothetical protein